MRKIVTSVGLVALGTAGLHAAAPAAGPGGRVWGASASLDTFYDDNINSIANNASVPNGGHRASGGFQVTPGLSLNWPWEEQTTITASYAYTFKYWENRPVNNTQNYDQNHAFNLALDHSFSENYQLNVKDSFIIGQEPDLLRTGTTFSDFSRVSGNNIRNSGNLTLSGQLSRELSFESGYANSLFKYSDNELPLSGFNGTATTAGALDRMEQAIHVDGRWQLTPESVGVLGYQFSMADYTADQPITAHGDKSDARNNYANYAYVGMDHQFQPTLTGSVRVGARITDYYNDPAQQSDLSPYVLLSLHYGYAPESYVEGGFSLDRSATDLIGTGGATGLTVDSQATSVYANLCHRLAPKLYGSIMAQFQNSDYNGGLYNGATEQYYTVGVNLEYRFSVNFSAKVGYNFDRLESEAPMNRSFDRNRFYLGLTASY